jgi:prevent-host-death family protein
VRGHPLMLFDFAAPVQRCSAHRAARAVTPTRDAGNAPRLRPHPGHIDDMYMMMYIASMSRRYSIADARMSLPTIIDRAEAGERIELTRRGKPVAIVVSLREFERLRGDRPRFGDAYKRFVDKYPLEEISLDGEFAAERDKGAGRKVSL